MKAPATRASCSATPPMRRSISCPRPCITLHFENLAKARKTGEGDAIKLGPDAKSQVTVKYVGGKPVGVTQIVLSTQHVDEDLTSEDVRRIVEPYIVKTLPQGWISEETIWHINPTGKFVIGGPDGDTGLTGRKIIVDTYGGAAPHGGGAFSGKDPTKVDRSAAYAARYLAKNVVAAGLADRVTIQFLRHRSRRTAFDLCRCARHGQGRRSGVGGSPFQDRSPFAAGHSRTLQLNRPIYARTSAYGHFGRQPDQDGGFSWEKTDLVEKLKAHFA